MSNQGERFPSSTSSVPELSELPIHIAVIMDGNGRWANRRGYPRIAGHRKGVEAVRELVRGCGEIGIPYLTLFAFSSENWRRPATEVRLLMDLLRTSLETQVRKLHENGVRLRVVGDLERFSPRVRALISNAEALTAENTELVLTVATNYGGRWDITQACHNLAQSVARGELDPSDVTAESIESRLSMAFLPEPDLFIRTGGEQRISNFLLWQLAYTELYFTDTLWPEFDRPALEEALAWFSSRQRRFGQTGEQVVTRQKAENA